MSRELVAVSTPRQRCHASVLLVTIADRDIIGGDVRDPALVSIALTTTSFVIARRSVRRR
jgi:hypothetical protein